MMIVSWNMAVNSTFAMSLKLWLRTEAPPPFDYACAQSALVVLRPVCSLTSSLFFPKRKALQDKAMPRQTSTNP
jgi:hypothetical protein